MRKPSWILLVAASCGSDPVVTPPPPADAIDYRVIVRGRLAAGGGNNSEASRLAHDTAAKSLRSQAIAVGLETHLAFTSIGEPSDYASIEVWTDLEKLRAYYADPAVQSAWAPLFQGAPSREVFRHPRGWDEWGTVSKAGQGKPPAFFFHLRNRMKLDQEEQNRLTHNRVAGGASKLKAMSLSDIGHTVNLGVDDDQETLFIDFWRDLGGANQFFTDPITQAGGAELFPGPFDVTVYAPTDWVQWTKGEEESGPIDGTWSIQRLSCNGVAQPIPELTVQIYNTQGSFIVNVPSTCTATISETYAYPTSSSIRITPTGNRCAPSGAACAPAFGGATSCPSPPPVEFEFELSAAELEFRRTSVGPPVDSCAAGEAVEYTMRRK